MIKLGITGTTTFENRRKIKNMIFTIKQNLGDEVMFVGIGDKAGADRHIRRYVLELDCKYQEANLPHTPQTLYSIMHKNFYAKPYNVKNFFLRNNTFARYVDKLIVFDDSKGTDRKIVNLSKALNKCKKKIVVVN
jgi:mRNA-degrading endonuclease HigB of HigAB toxin-antitoxin module|tara:strand:+ start:148 stop:552 length:405 start_codon:yes stop_codon:yes gene_type:complete